MKSLHPKEYYVKTGLWLSLILPMATLPSRISEGQDKMPGNLIGSTIGIFFMCYICWLAVAHVLQIRLIRFEWQKVTLCLLICVLISIGCYYCTHPFFEDYPLHPPIELSLAMGLTKLAVRGILIGVVICAVSLRLITQKAQLEEKIIFEQTKSKNLQNQLNALQQQIDSHFLFNTLNILKANQSDKWVKRYIVALSDVLRYQLHTGSRSYLSPIKDELSFVRSYLYLLRERFEDSLQVTIEVDSSIEQLKIPSYTLLTLVENAVKHNGMSVENPLCIDIVSTGSQLTVKNNVNLKINHFKASGQHLGLGLKNLNERYRLIASTSISIESDADYFTVTVPLLS